jgi:hypothetical protein
VLSTLFSLISFLPLNLIDIIAAIPVREELSVGMKSSTDCTEEDVENKSEKCLFNRRNLSSTFKKSVKKMFGRNKQPPQEFLCNYMLPPNSTT